LTGIAALDATYEITDDDLSLVMHDIEIRLRARADEKVKNALRIGYLRLAGHTPAESRCILGLTTERYDRAVEWLGSAMASGAAD
jgi:hypothetical protein